MLSCKWLCCWNKRTTEINHNIDKSVKDVKTGSYSNSYDDVAMFNTGDSITLDWPSGYQENKNRIRVLVNVKAGQYVSASMPLGSGCGLHVFGSRTYAIEKHDSVVLQNITGDLFAKNVEKTKIVTDGILTISLAKSNYTDTFTLEEYNSYLSALKFFIEDYGTESISDNLILNMKPLFIGSLVQRL